ncbi:N-formylglutamate amidohydrolase [Priestia endophytica]|uniref:N-formylglutamate amidohydrolase n=1 Tax=Priestia endophytica TaxID=135735 RepID=UPI002282679B|nr:N-formylglutamate amidohydrolase [Priestia endophytica]MCY8235326.1 N-formylglutamate amidohydrolase [Priestia endophytica]
MNPVTVERSNPVSEIIASIPHSSPQLTPEMIQSKKSNIILPNNDWFLNDLYNFLSDLNITKVSANYSRYVIDVNRHIGLKQSENEYTKSLIYRKSTFGKNIYGRPLSEEVITKRINSIYLPYHNTLSKEIKASLKLNNKAFLLDLHSFYIQSNADVVLGTCHDKSCSSNFLEIVRSAFETEGFTVKVDEKGLSGGYIVNTYGSWSNVEAIQIELRYTIYIENRKFDEEEVMTRNEELFNKTQNRLSKVFSKIKSVVN